MIKKVPSRIYSRNKHLRIAATETRARLLQSDLKLIELCLRNVLTTNSLDFKQRLIQTIASVVDTDIQNRYVDPHSEEVSSYSFWQEWASMPKQPQPFIIREEEHPLKHGASIFHVYTENMHPLYIGRESVGETETELRKYELVSSITILYREDVSKVTSPGPSTKTVPHDCFGESCPCQSLPPDDYHIYKSRG